MEAEENYRLYSAVEQREVEWLWYPYIPFGKITLLQGDPGDGKSTFILNIAACVSNGGILPDGTRMTGKLNVIYQCAEDNPNDTVKPRLIAAGADCSRIAFIKDEGDPLTISDSRLEDSIRRFRARLLILDPLQAFIPQDTDMQSATRMRAIMRGLSRVAERNRCAVVLVGHMTKASGGKRLYRGLGSIDIAAIARSVLMIARDEQHPQIRYMFPVKSSLSPEGAAIGFLFDEDAGFQWIGKCRMAGAETAEGHMYYSKKEKAKELIGVMLSAGDVPSAWIFEMFGKMGIGERTVREAQKEMGIQACRKNNVWYWGKPEETADKDVGGG